MTRGEGSEARVFHAGPTYPEREFNVLVAATMSAGKSTLLNALLGQELLYSSNEAATALHTRVCYAPGASGVIGAAYSRVGRLLKVGSIAGPADLQAWSLQRGVKRIDVIGNFGTLHAGRIPMTLHDIPGANNSANPGHATIALATIKNIPWDVLLYVVNAAHPGTTDDHRLLKRVKIAAKNRPRGKIIFVLNKLDLLDEGRGESVAAAVEATKAWAAFHGFDAPCVVPVMAGTGLAARLVLSGLTTSRRQQLNLRWVISALTSDDDHIAPSDWDRNALEKIAAASGLGALESLIRHEMDKVCTL